MAGKYYCMKCKRNHQSGDIYEKHKSFARVEGEKITGMRQINIDDRIIELILFTFLAIKKRPTYSFILKFLTSFGITTDIVLRVIIKKLKEGDIVYSGVKDENYRKLLEILLFSPRFSFPLTLTFKEAYDMFNGLKLRYANEFIDYIKRLARDNPEFIVLGSSKVGETPDLITFKQIFKDDVVFELKNNWVL